MSTRTEQSEVVSAAPPRRRVFSRSGQVAGERTGQLLGEWREHELARAKRTRVCGGLGIEQLEDVYQDTTEALLGRAFQNEEHLRYALRQGIRYRALDAHRNRRRHARIWGRAARGMQVLARVTQEEQSAEALLLAEEDRLFASEFLAELSGEEASVYWLMSVEHLGHINIARALGIPTTQARNTMRVCERKRERFQTVFDSGRLCGYRAQTIKALQAGEATSSDLARRALAHIQSCPHCHRAHGKLERDLRRAMPSL
jgi:DNA-directed RNA polymerase specialized sigma24 family protein